MYAVVISLSIMFSTILINAQEKEKKQAGEGKAKTEQTGAASTAANPQTPTTTTSTTTPTVTPTAGTTQSTNETPAKQPTVTAVPATVKTPTAQTMPDTGVTKPASTTPAASSQQPSSASGTAQQSAKPAVTSAQPSTTPTQPTTVSSTKTATVTQTGVSQVTKKTEAPKEKATQPEEKETPSYEKLETANLEEPSGNWLYKRIWYEKAEQKYDHIKELMSQIIEARSPFLAQRTDAEKTIFEPLYVSVGMSQGELSVILSYLMNEMNKLREKQGNLTPEEREFLDVLTMHQKTLEQLHLDVQALSKLDNDLDDALQKLMERINLCRGFENQAWEHFRAIAKELSDKTARELYYTIDALDKSVNDTLKWIKEEYSEYFDKVMQTAKEQATRIEAAVKELKEKGIDFNKQHDKIEKEAADREKEAQEQAKGKEIEKAVEQTKQELSWFYRLGTWWDSVVEGTTSAFEYIGNALGSAYDSIKGLFAGSEEQPEEEHKVPVQTKTPAPTVVAPVTEKPALEKEEKIVAPTIEAQPVVPGSNEQKQMQPQSVSPASAGQMKASSDVEKVIMNHRKGAITAAMNDDYDDLTDDEFNAQLAQDIEFA